MSFELPKKGTLGILFIIVALAIGIMAALIVRNNGASQEVETTASLNEEPSEEPIQWVESIPDTSNDYFISEADEIEARGFKPAEIQ